MTSSPPLALRGIRLLGPLLLACAAALPALFVGTAAHAATDDVAWTVRTDSNDLGADRTSYAYTLDPGATISDAIVVANHGDEDLTLAVYAADGHTGEDGALSLLVSGETSSAVGAWVSPAAEEITVAAGETASVPFTVEIPESATPGDYAGGIVTSLTVPDEAAGMNVDRRLGIRVDVRVGGELAPSLAVEDLTLGWDGGIWPFAGGDATLSFTLHNTGNTTIDADVAATVSAVFGWFPIGADAPKGAPELLPGESTTQRIAIPDVPAFIALFADATVTPLVVDAVGSTTPLDTVSATAFGWAVPWTLVGVVVLLAAAVVLLVWGRRRRRRAVAHATDAKVNEAVERALAQERAKTTAGAAAGVDDTHA